MHHYGDYISVSPEAIPHPAVRSPELRVTHTCFSTANWHMTHLETVCLTLSFHKEKAVPPESLESLAWSPAGLSLPCPIPLGMPLLLPSTGLPGRWTRQRWADPKTGPCGEQHNAHICLTPPCCASGCTGSLGWKILVPVSQDMYSLCHVLQGRCSRRSMKL